MYHNQQIQILMEKGHPNPDPHHQFMEDLITQVRIWRHQKKAILICLDAQSTGDAPQITLVLDFYAVSRRKNTRSHLHHDGRLGGW